jgi:hypothetical protein
MNFKGQNNSCFRHGHACRGKMTGEYRSYRAMLQRCYYPESISYKYYGANRITVCSRWRQSFANFIEDMGRKPDAQYSLERINPHGNYEPDNCHWVDQTTQRRNRRDTVLFVAFGQRRTLGEWAEIFGLKYTMVWERVKDGWSVERALTKPRRKYENIRV